MFKTYIYALIDPITDEVCYIGKTESPAKRLEQHLSERRMRLVQWILSLYKLGKVPTMAIIEETKNALQGNRREKELMWEHWERGCPLLNRMRWMESDSWEERLNGAEWYQQRENNND